MAAYTIDGKLRTIGGKAAIDVDCCECAECSCGICLAGDVPTLATITISGVAKKTSPDCDCLQFNGTFAIALTRATPTELVPCPPYRGEMAFTIPACGTRPERNVILVATVVPSYEAGSVDCFDSAGVFTSFQIAGGFPFEGVGSGTPPLSEAATCKGGPYGTTSRTSDSSSIYCNWSAADSSVTIT